MKNKRKLIISLIKDNLINTKLVLGLTDMGLDAGHYYLHLSETIMNLLKIKSVSDGQYKVYQDLCEKVVEIDIYNHPEQLDVLAKDVYKRLLILKHQNNN